MEGSRGGKRHPQPFASRDSKIVICKEMEPLEMPNGQVCQEFLLQTLAFCNVGPA